MKCWIVKESYKTLGTDFPVEERVKAFKTLGEAELCARKFIKETITEMKEYAHTEYTKEINNEMFVYELKPNMDYAHRITISYN